MDADKQEWIARARAVRLEDEIARRGIKLKRQGSSGEFVGPCPVCRGTDRFSINVKKRVWNCRGCQKGGDVIDLVIHLDDCKFENAATTLAGKPPPPKANSHGANGTKRPQQSGSKKEIAETYEYVDENGVLTFKVVRFHFRKPDGSLELTNSGKPAKSFGQCRPDPDDPKVSIWGLNAGEFIRRGPGQDWVRFDEEKWDKFPAATRHRKTVATAAKSVPYKLPELIEAASQGQTIFIVEGERKANLVAEWNIAATCNAGGAKHWTAEHAAYLRSAHVVIVPDYDDKGREHAEAVARSLQGTAARVRIVELPGLGPKQDIVDWAKAGGTREQIDVLVERAPDWRPQQEPSERQQTGGRGLVAHRASEIAIESVEWLWPGRIAIGKQTLIAGEAGLGKSQGSISIAATVTTGGEWPCNEGRSPIGSVVFLCAEDGAADTIVPRLMAAGADLTRVHIVSAVYAEDGKGHRAFNLQADLGLLAQKIGEIGDVRLIVIDPISSYMGPKVDSHVNAAVRGVLEPVGELASRMRIAIISITHPPKGTGTTAINRFIGSIAFVAAARSAFMVARDAEDNDRRLFLPVKNNLAPLGKGLAFRLEQHIVGPANKCIVASCVAWESSPITMSADEALRAADEGENGHRAIDEATEFLHDKLSAGPVPVREVEEHARALGISRRTLERARKTLQVQTVKTGFGNTGTWSLTLPKAANPSRAGEDQADA